MDIEENESSEHGMNDETIPSAVKVYFFQYNELKNAIFDAENANEFEMQEAQSALLEHLKIVFNEFRITHRGISVVEHNKFCKSIETYKRAIFVLSVN